MKKSKRQTAFETAYRKGFKTEKSFRKFLISNQQKVLEMMSEGRGLSGKRHVCDSSLIVFSVRYAIGRKTNAVSKVVQFVLDNWEKLEDREKELIVKEILSYEENYKDLGELFDRENWYRIINRNIYTLIKETI